MVVIGIIFDSLNDTKRILKIADDNYNSGDMFRQYAINAYKEEQILLIIYIVCFVFQVIQGISYVLYIRSLTLIYKYDIEDRTPEDYYARLENHIWDKVDLFTDHQIHSISF